MSADWRYVSGGIREEDSSKTDCFTTVEMCFMLYLGMTKLRGKEKKVPSHFVGLFS